MAEIDLEATAHVKVRRIPVNAQALYKIAREGNSESKVEWEDLSTQRKDYWRKLFNKLYVVPKLPRVGSVVEVSLNDPSVSHKLFVGVVIDEGYNGHVAIYDPEHLSDIRTVHISVIRSLVVAEDPFTKSEMLW